MSISQLLADEFNDLSVERVQVMDDSGEESLNGLGGMSNGPAVGLGCLCCCCGHPG